MIARINDHIYACAELILALVRATDDHRGTARHCRKADEAQARNWPATEARADATRDLSTIYRSIDRKRERDCEVRLQRNVDHSRSHEKPLVFSVIVRPFRLTG